MLAALTFASHAQHLVRANGVSVPNQDCGEGDGHANHKEEYHHHRHLQHAGVRSVGHPALDGRVCVHRHHAFAGRDAAVPFITGVFTEEEAAKSTDTLSDADLMSMKSWLEFYQKEKRYPFVGRLVGRYYDSEGKETEEMQRVLTRWENFKPPEEEKKRKKPKTTSQ